MDDSTSIAPLHSDDVNPLARLHQQAFPGFFLSTLGTPFLEQFYQGFLGDSSAVTVVARRDGKVVGAVVGTTEPSDFFARLLRRQVFGFLKVSMRSALVNPRTLPRLLRGVRYRGGTPQGSEGALLSSICVDPHFQGTGLGRSLLESWGQSAMAGGATCAFLTTDANENESVNRFYQRNGWTIVDTFTTRDGRRMHCYTTTLGAA